MTIKKYRYFFSFISAQEKWLNHMASHGYRLIDTTKLKYEFEICNHNEYEYCLEFVGNKSIKEIHEYKLFLEQMDYNVFTKNINLNYSIGKIRWRPYGSRMGQIAISPGNFNREILIIEKKRDGKPFNIYSNYEDLINYYKPFRNICLSFLIINLLILTFIYIHSYNVLGIILLLFIAIFLVIQLCRYTLKISKYKRLNKINE